jgi:UDP-3-O-[3-hydroxymyristoyl] N-acetylglucosamine deacetylase
MRTEYQHTVADRIELSGFGIHSGAAARMAILPGLPNTGIVFVRRSREGGSDHTVVVKAGAVRNTDFATVLGDGRGVLCSTVEHVLAAFAGLGVDNAIVEVEGSELPILDGSAAPFVAAIDAVGLEAQAVQRRFLKILKPVRVEDGAAIGELAPFERGFRLEVDIEFEHVLIGRQRYAQTLTPALFRRDLSRARTFGFMSDVAKLWSAGYGLGASLDNTVCLAEDRVLNPDGLRFPDEFVRHKALDAIGDLAVAGLPILGRYRSLRGGHRLNAKVVAALAADPSASTVVEAAGRRAPGHVELGLPAAVPAYSADVS